MKKQNKLKPLLVTTAHRGVFFGYGTPTKAKVINLKQARMCIFWSSDVKGVLGLAVTGPSNSCKIGPAVSEIILNDVTSITLVSDEGVITWEKQPWN